MMELAGASKMQRMSFVHNLLILPIAARKKGPSLLKCALVILALILANGQTRADDVPAGHLTLGYDGEGKIDASLQACTKYVKDEVEWNKADTARGIRNVCAARRDHLRAYQVLKKRYRDFLKAMTQDKRLDAAAAVTNFKTLVKACMDYKWNLTTGGHNIAIDINTNNIAAACLVLGSNLLNDETTQLRN
jgi:hypothetical protein